MCLAGVSTRRIEEVSELLWGRRCPPEPSPTSTRGPSRRSGRGGRGRSTATTPTSSSTASASYSRGGSVVSLGRRQLPPFLEAPPSYGPDTQARDCRPWRLRRSWPSRPLHGSASHRLPLPAVGTHRRRGPPRASKVVRSFHRGLSYPPVRPTGGIVAKQRSGRTPG